MKKSELKEVIKEILKEGDKQIDLTGFCDTINKKDWPGGNIAGSVLSEIVNTWDIDPNLKTDYEGWIDNLCAYIKTNLLS